MVEGRRKETRTHALTQAALVWGLAELAGDGVEAFLQYGEINSKAESAMPYLPAVEEKIAEIQANGGRLIVG